jgi:hypothetical protein
MSHTHSISEARKKELYKVRSLRNFLFNIFELYIMMKIDHTYRFNNCEVTYKSKDKRFLVHGKFYKREFSNSKLTEVSWCLRMSYGVINPNSKKEWINLHSTSA